ncbi:MAG: hypothetical protein WC130_03770 [Kiritimatiellia bacterium]
MIRELNKITVDTPRKFGWHDGRPVYARGCLVTIYRPVRWDMLRAGGSITGDMSRGGLFRRALRRLAVWMGV